MDEFEVTDNSHSKETYTNDLSVEIVIEPVDKNISLVNVGNTGLLFDVRATERPYIQQHFTPDGIESAPQSVGAQLKYSTLYAGGMYEFLAFYNDNKDQLPSKVVGYTNQEMIDFRKKLFGNHYKVGDSYVDSRGRTQIPYEFDMNDLLQDDQLVQRLEKYNKRMKSQDYKMKFPPFQNG